MSNGLISTVGSTLGMTTSAAEIDRRIQQSIMTNAMNQAAISNNYGTSARIDTNRTVFDVEKIENGYVMYLGSKKYFAESRNALGELMVVLLTQKENANGHD